MDGDARAGVARHERALDRRRPAPARQQRRMHVEPEPAVEQRVGDQQPVRRDDDRVGRDLDALVELRGLRDGNPESLRGLLGGCRRELAAAAARLVGTREQQRDLVLGGEALEDVGAEEGGRCDRDPHYPRTMRGRSLPSASRRASGVVRSSIRMPSRWSVSCWAARA